MKPLSTVAAAAVALVATVGPAFAAGGVDPGALPRGADTSLPMLHGDTYELRYGGRSVVLDLPGRPDSVDRLPHGRVLVGAGLVLASYRPEGSMLHVVARHPAYGFTLGSDRHRLAFVRQHDGNATVVVKNATSGRLVARRTLPGFVSVGALGDGRVFLTQDFRDSSYPDTLVWNLETGLVRTFARGWSVILGDLGAGRVVLHREDLETRPYPGCIRVVRPRSARDVLWRSCTWLPLQWSPDHRHALAIPLGTDGYATGRLRITDGRTGAAVRTYDGIFQTYAWEDDDSLVAGVQNDDSDTSGLVRLDVDGSTERVSALYDPTPYDGFGIPWLIEDSFF